MKFSLYAIDYCFTFSRFLCVFLAFLLCYSLLFFANNVLLFILELNDSKKQIEALQLLIALLPVPNRDTLKALLSCLAKVASFSQDTVDSEGNMVRL